MNKQQIEAERVLFEAWITRDGTEEFKDWFLYCDSRGNYYVTDAKKASEVWQARAELALAATPGTTCPRCGAAMKPGKIIVPHVSGEPDFPGAECVTVSISPGPETLADCMKCEACGHSVTGEGNGDPKQPERLSAAEALHDDAGIDMRQAAEPPPQNPPRQTPALAPAGR